MQNRVGSGESILERLIRICEEEINPNSIGAVIFYNNRSYERVVWCGPQIDISNLFLQSPIEVIKISFADLEQFEWDISQDISVYCHEGPYWGLTDSENVLLISTLPPKILTQARQVSSSQQARS